MSAVRSRIDRLERQLGEQGAGKLVVVRTGPSEDHVAAALDDRAIDAEDPRNLIIVLRSFGDERLGALASHEAQILYVMDRP